MDSFLLWVVYGFLFFAFAGWQYKSFTAISFGLVFLMTFNVYLSRKTYLIENQAKIIFYHMSQGPALDIISGRNVSFLGKKEPTATEVLYQVNPLRIEMHLPLFDLNSLQRQNVEMKEVGPLRLMKIEGKKIVWLDGLINDYELTTVINCDLLVLDNFSMPTASDIVQNFDCKQVVLSVPDTEGLKPELESMGFQVCNLWEDGIWIVDLKSKKKPWDS